MFGYKHGCKKPWFIFIFIRVKTMATFVSEHGKSEKILDALEVVKLLADIKNVINLNTPKFQQDYECSLIWKWARFHLFFFFFFFFLGAGLLMSFHGHSCLSILITWIQPRAVAGAGAGMVHHFFLFFFWATGMVPPGSWLP